MEKLSMRHKQWILFLLKYLCAQYAKVLNSSTHLRTRKRNLFKLCVTYANMYESIDGCPLLICNSESKRIDDL